MNDLGGWQPTSSETRRFKLLGWLTSRSFMRAADQMEPMTEFLGFEPRPVLAHPRQWELWDMTWGNQVAMWRDVLQDMQRRGLIVASGIDGIVDGHCKVRITEQGVAELEAMTARQAAESARQIAEEEAQQKRRADPVLRRAAAANGILRWMYEQDPDGDQRHNVNQILASEHSMFEEERLPEGVIRRAARFLQEHGLIRSDDGTAESQDPINMQITPQGLNCVEIGVNVADYLRSQHDRATNITTNFNAPVSGNVTWASTHVTQTASTTGLASDEIGVLVRAIVEAIPALGLPDDQAATVRGTVDIIQGELGRNEPDQNVVKTMMRRTLDALTGATSTTLGLLLTGYAKELMKSAGIPIE